MKILVPIKRVPDPYAKVRPSADGTALDLGSVKFEINPFDEIAIEEAVRQREVNPSIEIIAVTIGGPECEEQLRKALAMGADRAILIESTLSFDPPAVAKEIAALVAELQPNLVLMGKQATDDDSNQAGQMLAAHLDWPQATYASKVVLGAGTVEVTRETDSGDETLKLELPALVTTDLRLNEPRYIALPGIIKARSKPLERRQAATNPTLRTRTTKYEPTPSRGAGVVVKSVEELVSALRAKGAI